MKVWIGLVCALAAIGGGLFAYDRIAHRERYELYQWGRYYRRHHPDYARVFVHDMERRKDFEAVMGFGFVRVPEDLGSADREAFQDLFVRWGSRSEREMRAGAEAFVAGYNAP